MNLISNKKINVGIDLGTTYSAVAVFSKEDGRVKILKNSMGEDCTPSVVCLENGDIKIGEDAKAEQKNGNLNTVAFYKSMMGDENYTAYIEGKEYSAQELSGKFLSALKKDIEETNGFEIGGAVITVPAYFNEKQRDATIKAGRQAGLNVLKIINEPTSAIIAYGLTGGGEKNVLVYDLGGGTFDVTIAHVSGTTVDVISTNGNHQLGGRDWDEILVSEIKERFYDEFGVDLEFHPEDLQELWVKCEEAKKRLSSVASSTISIQSEGYTGKYEVTREAFDDKTYVLLYQTIMLINSCFDEISASTHKSFGWSDIDEVVLVGGSTRMPQVKNMIISEYGKPPITKDINVDTIVATGAAMQAELCINNTLTLTMAKPSSGSQNGQSPTGSGGYTLTIKNSDIQDITAHSLGMLAFDSKDETNIINSIIIPKNSKMNEVFGRKYAFSGETLDVYVLQGELNDPFECTLLYKYVISGMPKGQKNEFTVDFLYNSNGTVEVYAELNDGRKLSAKQMQITESLEQIIARLRQEREEAKKAANKDVEIMFMLDTSYSMVGDPMSKAKQAMRDFVNELDLSRTKIAILDFADRSRWVCSFSSSEGELSRAINSLNVEGPCGIGNAETPLTNRGCEFKSRNAVKIIVVLTDGVWNDQNSEIHSASRLKQEGVIIYAVGFGGADQHFLEQIASEKGARKIDLSQLNNTFKEIASSIATEM